MKNDEGIGRREILTSLVKWSAAALSIGGLQGLMISCSGNGGPASAPSAPDPLPGPWAASYVDASNYANYFDYANYSNYSNYINGPVPTYVNYSDYSDYANYANYGDYFDHVDAYSDAYSDYLNYANYADYNDYSDYFDYFDYSDYSDYFDYTDYTDLSTPPLPKRLPAGRYADYADAYADTSLVPGEDGRPAAKPGRAQVSRPPFRSIQRRRPKGGAEGPRASAWIDLPEQRLSQVDDGGRLQDPPTAKPADLHGQAHQGDPDSLQRPVRQKEGKRPRQLLGPGNKKRNQGSGEDGP
jgi:hypothetical protein